MMSYQETKKFHITIIRRFSATISNHHIWVGVIGLLLMLKTMLSIILTGMPPFQEIVNHAKKKNLTLLHQNNQIQNIKNNHMWLLLSILPE